MEGLIKIDNQLFHRKHVIKRPNNVTVKLIARQRQFLHLWNDAGRCFLTIRFVIGSHLQAVVTENLHLPPCRSNNDGVFASRTARPTAEAQRAETASRWRRRASTCRFHSSVEAYGMESCKALGPCFPSFSQKVPFPAMKTSPYCFVT